VCSFIVSCALDSLCGTGLSRRLEWMSGGKLIMFGDESNDILMIPIISPLPLLFVSPGCDNDDDVIDACKWGYHYCIYSTCHPMASPLSWSGLSSQKTQLNRRQIAPTALFPNIHSHIDPSSSKSSRRKKKISEPPSSTSPYSFPTKKMSMAIHGLINPTQLSNRNE
jgi:hypothetical protein